MVVTATPLYKMAQTGELELENSIGFEGSIHGGVVMHPDGRHLIYSLGGTVVVRDLSRPQYQSFLHGHTNNVSCLACSSSGSYLASGQSTHMGFKADVIVWKFDEKELYCRFVLHKVKVQALAFSPSDHYLATLGGLDDGSVVIWNLETRDALCGSPAAMQSVGPAYCLAFANCRDDLFVTGGNYTLRVWEIDEKNRKIRPKDCNLGQMKRIVNCVKVAEDDSVVYCGTTTGDILTININTCLFNTFGPQKDKYSLGISALELLPSGRLMISSGDGVVAVLDRKTYKRQKRCQVDGAITSLALKGSGHEFFIGTSTGNLFRCSFSSFAPELTMTCHNNPITDIAFPLGSSELFATSSVNDVRVWHAATGKELLRLSLPKLTCNAVVIRPDGKAIITGWNDGKIRSFHPESGKAMYTIHDAHSKGVTALAALADCQTVVSGGAEGQVRVWHATAEVQTMKAAMKEHRGAVTCVRVRGNGQECVTASNDGTCIVWDLSRYVRNQVIFANTMFQAVCYLPDECQLITGGTDRKVGYWEVYDGAQIRELEGSQTSSINGIDISSCGRYFVTGGDDRVVKVWLYNEGELTHAGIGHSGNITRVRISPDGQHIVSVSEDGGILRWRFPHGGTSNGSADELL